MMYVDYYFEASSLPLYLRPVAEMMRSVKNCLFVHDSHFSIFVRDLRNKLKMCVKANSDAYISYSGHQVHVFLKKNTDNSVLRLGVQSVCGCLEYFEAVGLREVKIITSKDEKTGGEQ